MLNDIYQSLDPVIFSFGFIELRWYGLAYVLGFAFAALVIWRVAKRWKVEVSADALLTIILCVIVGVILGARLGYVLFYGGSFYWENPLYIFAFSMGGMSFHGGLMGALLAGIVAAKITKIPYLTLADMGCIAAPIGLFFGRCANFINGELWGAPTDAPWGVVFGGSAGMVPRHPTQLYEAALEGIVLFVVLYALSRKVPPRPRGTFLGLFLTMYGSFRFVIEFVREPDVQLGYLYGDWLTMGQVLSMPLIVVGIAVLIYALVKKPPQLGLQVQGAQAQFGPEGRAEEIGILEERSNRRYVMDVKFYRCTHCGNIAVKPFDSGVPLVCCGEKMEELTPNTVDAAVEKHVPVIKVEGAKVNVEVGSVAHPMTEEHYITFICLVTEKGYQTAPLTPADEPAAAFAVAEGDKAVKAYEYCNLHGLWVADA